MFVEGTRAHRHVEFRRLPGSSAADIVAAMGRALQAASRVTSAVIACSPDIWREFAGDDTPEELSDFPTIAEMPATQRDIWLWCHGAEQDALLDAGLAATEALAGLAAPVDEVIGFVYHDERDLMGFIDGTENPDADEAPDVIVLDDDEPGSGGTYAMTQRWVHDLTAWARLDVDEQELIIGRTKADSIELDDDVQPIDSHVSRTVVEDEDGEELEIYRRSVPYGTVTEHGLHFVAFCDDPDTFTVMLERMYGVSDGVRDRIVEFSRPVSGSYWFVPSLEALG